MQCKIACHVSHPSTITTATIPKCPKEEESKYVHQKRINHQKQRLLILNMLILDFTKGEQRRDRELRRRWLS